MWEGRAAIQRGLDCLEKWTDRNLRKNFKDNCEMQQYRLDTKRIENTSTEKELKSQADNKLIMG